MLFLTRLRAHAYDVVQRALGLGLVRERVTRLMARAPAALILDVGGGTGLYVPCLPSSARYVWLDLDPVKLAGFRARHGPRAAILADGSRLPLRDKSVDYVMCINVTHHLDDAQLERLFSEVARVTRGRVALNDALRTTAWASRLLWMLDGGSHPRPRAALIAALERTHHIESVEDYSRFHQYVLISASPLAQSAG